MKTSVLILIMFFTPATFSRDEAPKCPKPGSLCNFDLTCLIKQRTDRWVRKCSGLSYPNFYEGSAEAQFRLTSKASDGHSSWKFVILSESWKSVNGCCDLTVNQTCMIRPLNKDVYFTLFGWDGEEFCYQDIQEYPDAMLKWCDEEEVDADCFKIGKRGVVLKQKWLETTVMNYGYSKVHYCFFEVHVDNTAEGTTGSDGLIRNVRGMKLKGQQVELRNESMECLDADASNFSEIIDNYALKVNYSLCYFASARGSWFQRATCVKTAKPGTIENGTPIWAIVLGVVVAASFCVSVALGFWRHKIKTWFPSDLGGTPVIPNDMLDTEAGKTLLNDDTRHGTEKEFPDVITHKEIVHALPALPEGYIRCAGDDNDTGSSTNSEEYSDGSSQQDGPLHSPLSLTEGLSHSSEPVIDPRPDTQESPLENMQSRPGENTVPRVRYAPLPYKPGEYTSHK